MPHFLVLDVVLKGPQLIVITFPFDVLKSDSFEPKRSFKCGWTMIDPPRAGVIEFVLAFTVHFFLMRFPGLDFQKCVCHCPDYISYRPPMHHVMIHELELILSWSGAFCAEIFSQTLIVIMPGNTCEVICCQSKNMTCPLELSPVITCVCLYLCCRPCK